jgi:2-polyprenyl-6-hydroxyphenyl methylase/3-demethylubiquinone-9 3-methyltransferase
MNAPLTLRPRSAEHVSCKICGHKAPVFGTVDFNKSCEERHGTYLEPKGVPVSYYRCATCGFLFTDAFDDWDQDMFRAHIYNAGYIEVDPGYRERRPAANAAHVLQLFAPGQESLRLLDWGGGNGVLADTLRRAAFGSAETYDAFAPDHATEPVGTFDVVTCYETIEHLTDPRAGITAIAARVGEPGMAVFSTLVQPADIGEQRTSWWYLAPRNGHVSLFTREALYRAWSAEGFVLASLNDNIHIAFRRLPAFFRQRVAE